MMEKENNIYQSPAYVRSRVGYYIQCITEYFVVLLVSDAFLAKLLKSMGLTDATIGIVSSLISLSFLIQLFTILLMRHVHNVKKTVVLIDVSSMLCFGCTFLLPFIPVSPAFKTVLVFAAVGGGYLLKYLQMNIYFMWANSFVDPAGRGAFSARNEAISLVAGVIFTVVMGMLVDRYEAAGELNKAFLLIACVILFLAAIDLSMLLMIRRYDPEKAESQHKGLKDVLKNTLGQRNFRNAVIMICIFEIARYFTLGFLGTFKTEDLLLSVGTVQLINIAANMARCVLSRPAGRWADKTSFVHVFGFGLVLCLFSFLPVMFTRPGTWWLIIVHTVLFNVSLAFLCSNMNNMTYSYVPIEYYVQAQALRSSLGGLLGFVSALAGSAVLSLVQEKGLTLFGEKLYGQQVLAGVTCLLLVVALVFCKKVVEKQPVMRQ